MRMLECMEPNSETSFRSCGYLEDLEKIDSKKLYKYYEGMLKKDIVDIFVIDAITIIITNIIIVIIIGNTLLLLAVILPPHTYYNISLFNCQGTFLIFLLSFKTLELTETGFLLIPCK